MEATHPHTPKSLRIALGLSIDAVAERSGISRRTILDVEAARAVPSIDTIAALAAALDVSVEALTAAFNAERARRAKGAA